MNKAMIQGRFEFRKKKKHKISATKYILNINKQPFPRTFSGKSNLTIIF